MFEVRLSVNSEQYPILQYVDFSEADKGLLRLRAPYASYKFTDVGKKIGLSYPIKIETYINGYESVGMVFLSRELIQKSNELMSLRTYGIKEPISGTIDRFTPHFVVDSDQCPYLHDSIKQNEKCLFIRFVTKHYHQLLMNKNTNGISSLDVNIKLFVDGKFKPRNDKQLISTGYEIIDKQYPKSSEFYDLEFISFEKNNLDKDGNDLPKPLHKTITSFKDVRYFK